MEILIVYLSYLVIGNFEFGIGDFQISIDEDCKLGLHLYG